MANALEAAFHDMQQQITHLQQAMQLQAQQLAIAPAAVLHPIASPEPGVPRVSLPRLAPPPFFDGQSNKVDEWITNLQQQFDYYESSFSSDAQRLRFASAYLKGPALDWWSNVPVAGRPTTISGLYAAIRGRFQPISSADTARAKLLNLTQGKGSVHDYVSAFRRLLILVPTMSEDDRLFQFIRGLPSAAASQLKLQAVATVEEAIAMATRIGAFNEYNGWNSRAAPASAAMARNDSSAMDLDNIEGLEKETADFEETDPSAAPVTRAEFAELLNAMRQSRGQSKGNDSHHQGRKSNEGKSDIASRMAKKYNLSLDQVREHWDKSLCFNCSKKGHASHECRGNKKN